MYKNKVKICRLALTATLAINFFQAAIPVTAKDAAPAAFKGEGMVISVIDNGFFAAHECFSLTSENNKLTKELSDELLKNASAGKGENGSESLYLNEKIPFAYDYADCDPDVYSEKAAAHGTAIASIAAGNPANAKTENPGASGIAPEAQLLLMKVYSDETGNITETALVNALEDSVLLGADVILLTLSDICGIESEPDGMAITAAIEKAISAGVQVVCPAGNVFEYGKESFFLLEYDSDPLPTASVDRGTVAWPGTVPGVITAASAVDNEHTGYLLKTEYDEIPYSDSNYLYPELTNGKLFSTAFAGQTLEYVLIDGVGTPEDFAAAGDITGKVAVVKRGTVSFSEKSANAAAVGAVAVIVVDNQPQVQLTLNTKTDLSEAVIPLILVPENCKRVFELEEKKEVTVAVGETFTVTTRNTPYPSEFSAMGTTPELSLKPDIAAVGSDVYCASADGGYTRTSSTAASAAKIAGMYVCVKQALSESIATTDATTLSAKAKAILCNSSVLMTYPTNGLPYSPRKQGTGCADLEAALSSKVLLHSDGNLKIELGELSSPYITFRLTAVNLSDEPQNCTVDATVLTDGYKTYTVSDIDSEPGKTPLAELIARSPEDKISFISGTQTLNKTSVRVGDGFYQLNRSADDYAPFKLTLAPLASVSFKVSVSISADEYKAYKEAFENGFFVEGFVSISAEDCVSSIPFLGFMGDFGKAPALDTQLYEGTAPLFDGVYLYRNGSESAEAILGEIPGEFYGECPEYDVDKLYFNPKDRGFSSVIINFGLLRTVTDVSVTVCYPNGEILKRTEYGTLPRTHLSAVTGMLESPRLPVFSGRADDNFKYVYPDGIYTVTVEFKKPSSKMTESISYKLRLDATAPTITDHSFTVTEYKCLLTVNASDNMALDKIYVIDSNLDEAPLTEDGKFDTSMLTGDFIYIDAFDYAGNRTTVRIDNPVHTPDVN